MSQPFVGQIIPVGFNFAPQGWFLCNGQLLPISEYEVLYNLLGTTYGGDGQSTFALPNLCGCVAVGMGQGAGLQSYVPGQTGGSEQVTVTASQLGGHTHLVAAASTAGTTNTPSTAVVPATSASVVPIYSSGTPAVAMASGSIGASGGSQPHENRQPFLAINYIIAWAGVYPSQN